MTIREFNSRFVPKTDNQGRSTLAQSQAKKNWGNNNNNNNNKHANLEQRHHKPKGKPKAVYKSWFEQTKNEDISKT